VRQGQVGQEAIRRFKLEAIALQVGGDKQEEGVLLLSIPTNTIDRLGR